MSYTYLSITIRPKYEIFQDEEFQKVTLEYFIKELYDAKKIINYLISWEHGGQSDFNNHYQIAIECVNSLRGDNIKQQLLSRLEKFQLRENKVWYKCAKHPNPEGLLGYCWKEHPDKYLTTYQVEYLEDCVNKYMEIVQGKAISGNVYLENLIDNIEQYCSIMGLSLSSTDPWNIVKEFIKQGKLSFITFKKIKYEDLDMYWKIKHCGY